MKVKSILFTCLCILTSSVFTIVNAQSRDSLLRIYNNETIQTSGNSFVRGDKRLKFAELKSTFTSGITKDLYKKAKGQRILGGVTTFGAITALVAAVIVRKNNPGAAYALSIGGVGLNILSLHFNKHSTELLDRAIWQRNKEILFGTTP